VTVDLATPIIAMMMMMMMMMMNMRYCYENADDNESRRIDKSDDDII